MFKAIGAMQQQKDLDPSMLGMHEPDTQDIVDKN